MFDRVDLVEKSEKFMNFMINAIPTQAAANWTKFENFFNMIKQVAIGGEPQLEFMKHHQLETLLADFFLAERSPIRQADDKRMMMGNNYSKPMFDSLVQTICYLSRHTDPRENLEFALPPTTMQGKIYPPGENEKKVLVNKHFANKAIKDAFEADAVGKLIAHWCYENEENTEIFAGVLLKGVNLADYEEIFSFLTAGNHFLSLKDSLQPKRLEMLLGTPMMLDGSMIQVCPPDLPKLGVYAIQSLSDEVFYYPSTLKELDAHEESILSLIFRSKKRFEKYTMFCIKELLTLGDATMKYIFSMPSPTYQYAKYSDWIIQFVEEKHASNLKDSEVSEESMNSIMEMLKKYQEEYKDIEVEIKSQHQKVT
jgi:hypothetical protein